MIRKMYRQVPALSELTSKFNQIIFGTTDSALPGIKLLSFLLT